MPQTRRSDQNSEEPTITVIIPVYNRLNELRRALQSLAEQTIKNFEVLVCDDGSEEDVKSVVKCFSDRLSLRYLRLKHTGLPSEPRNIGIEFASGEWISFLDSDDWWCPDRIKAVSTRLTNGVDVVFHKLIIAQEARRKIVRARCIGRTIKGDAFTDMLRRGNPIPTSSAIVRKSVLKASSSFCISKGLVAYEDFDKWLLLAKSGARFLFINRPLGYYWIGSNNISRNYEKSINSQKMLFRRHCDNLPDELAKWAKSYNNYVIGTYYLKLGRPKDALAAFRNADHLCFHGQRLKRLVKIIIAAIQLTI
jgi:glycosyltransferase involved in cell wall biosynthesis